MKEKQTERFYTAPQMKVLEIKARKMLCQSPGTEKYTRVSWETNIFEEE